MRPILIVGDAVLDQDLEGRVERLAADAPVPVVDGLRSAPRPGGAGLAACLAVRTGQPVRLLTALCDDEGGRTLRRLLEETGVEILDLGRAGTTPEKLRVRAAGQTLLRLDRGEGAGRPGPLPPDGTMQKVIRDSGGVVISDYGYGMAADPGLRSALGRVSRRVPVLWDPHPRGPAPVPGARLVTPNRRESGLTGRTTGEAAGRARELRATWQADAVAITLGAEGAILVTGEDAPPLRVPAPLVAEGDPCGAGDSLAVAAGCLLAAGASVEEAVEFAVARASEFVAEGGAAARWRLGPPSPPSPSPFSDGLGAALSVAERVRGAGGRVVVTGGCFDVLHAGHVRLLEAARGLGDALIVLVNSDRGVRALKGPGRPVNPEADRVRVLASLRWVDAVATFDEPTPVEALRRLRPDVFVKGGEYRNRSLPEQPVLRSWGGEVVLLPHLDGHSTTRLIKEMALHAGN
ncbi:MAG: bifunctional heptose 7-phosphate kinase/heptose 1-phosphate adenyltransferase [Candidatus Dormibacteraeota bacterium]|nr:bifunctional heptose 7-phosphate kinase/heptose 1-phosphate adenyltransferase [Candidatus Dormibacteraeota bacterium]